MSIRSFPFLLLVLRSAMGIFSRSKKSEESKVQILSEEYLSLHADSLMAAARSGEPDAILAMYFQKKDLTATDNDGNNALHVAAMNSNVSVFRLLVILTAPLELWKSTNQIGLTPSDVAVGDEIRADLALLDAPPIRPDDIHSQFNDTLVEAFAGWNSSTKLLVSFDGGGVKSLIINQMLIHLEHLIPGGFCDRIDWLAGTSSGGVLALMLGVDRDLDDCRRFLIENVKRVFCGKSITRIPKHDARGNESVSKDQFGLARMHRITKMKVLVTVADSRKSPPTLLLFRSYSPDIPEEVLEKYQYLDPSGIMLWKAARCTTAAPYYFDSYNGLSDGGLVANNPTQVLISDFYQVRKLEAIYNRQKNKDTPSEKHPPLDKIGVIVSFGSGNIIQERTDGIDVNFQKAKNPFQLARNVLGAMSNARNAVQLLIRECTASGRQPAKYSRDWAHSLELPYFRFTPHLTQDIPLDSTEVEDIIRVLWETELYVRGEAHFNLLQVAKMLETKEIENKEGPKPFDSGPVTELDLRSENHDLRSPVDPKK